MNGAVVQPDRVVPDRAVLGPMLQSFHRLTSDPDLALVQVHTLHALYWDVKQGKIVQLYEMAKADMTGRPPADLGVRARRSTDALREGGPRASVQDHARGCGPTAQGRSAPEPGRCFGHRRSEPADNVASKP